MAQFLSSVYTNPYLYKVFSLIRNKEISSPLLVYGAPGCGLTSMMAKCASLVRALISSAFLNSTNSRVLAYGIFARELHSHFTLSGNQQGILVNF
jgi:hypothetical protein